MACICTAAGAHGQAIQFEPVPKEVIEQRLKQAPFKNADREAQLRRFFEEAGCQGKNLSEPEVSHSREPNLVCVLPGRSDSVVVVGAHFDHVSLGEGAVDNWSGASLLPSLYQSTASQQRKHTFVFIGFTSEEQGLVGSKFYVQHLTAEEKAKIRAMVDIDSIGMGPTKVWVSHSNPGLVQALLNVARALKLPLEEMNVEQVGTGDSEPFRNEKIPAVLVHSVTQQTWPILHSMQDNLAAIHLGDHYDTYHLLAAYLAYLDGILK